MHVHNTYLTISCKS